VPLYVVATPIGNLQDLTARAREVLASCDGVVAEDTRYTGQLLKHLGIEKKPFHALPAYDEARRAEAILDRLGQGASLALVTDAGTPAVSDPGALLVRRAVEQGVPVVPVPGPSAAIAAVSVSGFTEPRFHFAGERRGRAPRCSTSSGRCVLSSSSTNRRTGSRRPCAICGRRSETVPPWSRAS